MSVTSFHTTETERRSHDAESQSSPMRVSGSYSFRPPHNLRRVSGGSTPRGARGSSTTATQLELMADLKTRDRHMSHMSDMRTEYGSFQSKPSVNQHRSMRLDSEGYSRLSSQMRKVPQRKRGAKLADFMIGDKIGEGSYARVHVARGKESGKLYAMKVMDAPHIKKHGKVRAVKLEMETLSKVSCSHVVRLFYAFKEGSSLYLVLELCQGGDLTQLITHYRSKTKNKKRCIPMKYLIFYVGQTIAGLQYLHHNGYVHRDIKPGNLLLSDQGHIKIADFGTVKNERHKEPDAPEFVGSPNYVSPEVLDEADFHSVGTDLWAVGVLIYHLCVGVPPFLDETEYRIFDNISKHNEQSLINLPETGKQLSPKEMMAEDLINKLLRVNPSERLGAANNRTPIKADYDKENNQPRLLREHGLFNGFDWTMTEMNEAPPNPVQLTFEEPEHDGAENNWLMLGDATDLDLMTTFSKQVRKQKGRPNRTSYNQLSATLKTMDIQQSSRISNASANDLSLIKIKKPKSKVNKTKSNRSQKLSSFLTTRPTLTQITGRIQGVKKKIQLKRARRGSKDSTFHVSVVDDKHIHRFLDDTEEIVLMRQLKKRNGLFLKARHLVLTTKPRFLWFDPARPDRAKGEVLITPQTQLFVSENENEFKIVSDSHSLFFVDKDSAVQWRAAFLAQQGTL